MSAIKILIVEDNVVNGMALEEALRSFGYIKIYNYQNSSKALAAFKSVDPDLMILDIELVGSKLNGIQLASKLQLIKRIPLIFLTSFSDTKTFTEAYKTNPSYYLVKPTNNNQIRVAIDMALKNFSKSLEVRPSDSFQNEKEKLDQIFMLDDDLYLKQNKAYKKLRIADIVFIEAANSSIVIYTDENSYFNSYSMANFEREFKHPSLVRIERSYMINFEKIDQFTDRLVHLRYKNDIKKISVGKTYRQKFIGRFRAVS